MAVLCWMAVTLVLLLSAENCLANVDQNHLEGFVYQILQRYTPNYKGSNNQTRNPMFSLAVSIPYNSESKTYDISQVTDDGEAVRDKILKCKVYTGRQVVAATVLRWPNVLEQCPHERVQWTDILNKSGQGITWADVEKKCPDVVWYGRADHAEYRTLQHFDTLVRNLNKKDFLLFYVLASPCDARCTNKSSPRSILDSINKIMNWKNYAVVFSNIFQPRSGYRIPEQNLRGAIERLATHKGSLGSIGLRNIFRCKRQNAVQCTSCSADNEVAPICLSDN